MAKRTLQLKYNQGIDNIAYMIINHPEPLKKLLLEYGISFEKKPTPQKLSATVITQFQQSGVAFQKDIEQLILRLSKAEEDQFLGGLIKGAIGVVGGIISKSKQRKRRRRASAAAAREEKNYAAAQAAQAKRDLELRMRRMAEEQRKREAAAKLQREKEARERKEVERKRAADSKKKMNMILAIGGGVAFLGIGAMVLMKTSRPPIGYQSMRPPTMPPM